VAFPPVRQEPNHFDATDVGTASFLCEGCRDRIILMQQVPEPHHFDATGAGIASF
jgi:hypothetical protein